MPAKGHGAPAAGAKEAAPRGRGLGFGIAGFGIVGFGMVGFEILGEVRAAA